MSTPQKYIGHPQKKKLTLKLFLDYYINSSQFITLILDKHVSLFIILNIFIHIEQNNLNKQKTKTRKLIKTILNHFGSLYLI